MVDGNNGKRPMKKKKRRREHAIQLSSLMTCDRTVMCSYQFRLVLILLTAMIFSVLSFSFAVTSQQQEDAYATTLRFFLNKPTQGSSPGLKKEQQSEIEQRHFLKEPAEGSTPVLPKEEKSKIEPGVTVNIFFHTYAGPTELHRSKSRQIVDQQIRYMGEAALRNSDYAWILRYSTVGNATVLDPRWFSKLCQEYSNNTLECHHLGHMEEGHEEHTIEKMHSHCRSTQDPANATKNHHHLVAYIHSKGAFVRPNMDYLQQTNEKWMPSLTRAPMSAACLASLLPREASSNNGNRPSATCNVCGLQFYPLWAMFMPGNFYSAHCSYINKLMPIRDYTDKMQQLASHVRPKRGRRPGQRNPDDAWSYVGYINRDDHYGVGRYSNEHWIGHPDIRPCDITPSNHTGLFCQLSTEHAENVIAQSDSLLQPAPRVPLFEGKWYRFKKNKLNEEVAWAREHNHSRPHSYFLLPGILYRFHFIYGSFPPADSWIWNYYPHGDVWKARVQDATNNSAIW